MRTKSTSRPVIRWRPEIAMAAGLLISLLAVLVVELRGSAPPGEKSSSQGRTGTGPTTSESTGGERRGGIAPTIGLVSPPGSDATTGNLEQALRASRFEPTRLGLEDL